MPSSPRRESVLMIMSLPLWLRVSSEYPSSNLFAFIAEPCRKAWRYEGIGKAALFAMVI
jgi:hypothetical protein